MPTQRLRQQLLGLLAAFTLPHTTLAVDLRYGPLNPDEPTGTPAVILSGEIKKGDYENLLRFARKDPHRFHASTVVLASSGGNLLEAMRIGTFLRRTYQNAFVSDKIGKCASACFLIYVAAVERSALVPSVGIHRPYFPSSEFDGMSLEEAQTKHRWLMDTIRQYLEEQDVPRYLIERMFSLASTEIYWLNRRDLDAIGRRANWWDQVLVNRCKLDKRLEQKYLSGETHPQTREAEAEKHIYDVAVCAYEISAEERKRNLSNLLSTKP